MGTVGVGLMSTRASGGMADALASGASIRKDVRVQVPPRPPLGVLLDLNRRESAHKNQTDTYAKAGAIEVATTMSQITG